jgi:hypothetical protein
MALRRQLGADLAKRHAVSRKLFGEGDRLRPDFSVRLATAALARFGLLTISSLFQLGDQPRLFVLRKAAGDLPHHRPRWIAAIGQIIPARRHHRHAAPDQSQNAQFLHHEIASKAAGILDQHGSDAIAFNAVQQGREARARLDRVGAADCGISLGAPRSSSADASLAILRPCGSRGRWPAGFSGAHFSGGRYLPSGQRQGLTSGQP